MADKPLSDEEKAAWLRLFAEAGIPLHPYQARTLGVDVPEPDPAMQARTRTIFDVALNPEAHQ